MGVDVTGLVDATLLPADGPLVVTAEVTPATGQGDDAHDDEDATSTAVTHAESLGITTTVVDALVAGGTGTFGVTVRDDGPSAAHGVVVTADLPAGLSYAGGVSSDDDWTCSGTTSVVCALDGVLGVGASAASSFTFDVAVASGVTGDVVTTAVVGSRWQGDQDDDEVTTTVTAHAELSLATAVLTAPVAGGTGVYRVQVANRGPSDARDVVVTATLPAGLTSAVDVADVAAASTADWECSGTSTVVCALDAPLAPGEVARLDLRVSAASWLTGDVVVTATVSSSTPGLDGRAASATDRHTLHVEAPADPADPADPVDPVDPADPAAPAAPVDQAEPVDRAPLAVTGVEVALLALLALGLGVGGAGAVVVARRREGRPAFRE